VKKVSSVSVHSDYKVEITFDSGISGILDMKPYLDFGIFSRLRDQDEFRKVRVSFDTIEWSCGVDIDPEFLWENVRFTSEV
jgi:hypothetical protein